VVTLSVTEAHYSFSPKGGTLSPGLVMAPPPFGCPACFS
jgi:hypothetical protein